MAKNKARDDRDDDRDRPKRSGPVKRDGAYLMMLFITLVAIVTGAVLLYLDNEEYGKTQPTKENAPTVRPLGAQLPPDPVAPAPAPAPASGS